MTIDDESSVYIGGLPYDATEDSIRRVFDLYGAIVAVKIINDHGTRGKCYGFVTYTNPRSAVDAINDMNGRTIEGRVVKVNGVRTRGARSNFASQYTHSEICQNGDWDRGRLRGREYDRDRVPYPSRDSDFSKDNYRSQEHGRFRERDRSHERNRSRELDQEKVRKYNHMHDLDQVRDPLSSGDVDRNETQEQHGNHLQDRERDYSLNFDRDGGMDQTSSDDARIDKVRDDLSRKSDILNGFAQPCLELSDSNHNYSNQVKDQFERSSLKVEELRKEVCLMEEKLKDMQLTVLDLQKKCKKLEDALISAKKQSSYRKMQLTKLHKCFLQVRDYSERLKTSEQELKALVDTSTVMLENDSNAFALNGGDHANGAANSKMLGNV